MRAAVQAAVAFQRGETGKEHEQSRAALEAEGCEIAELPRDGHEAFVRAVQPLYDDARSAYGEELFRLLPKP
jgi:TRAP-type C4-dicarboxylate transport system substrate-binding protein